MQKKKDEVRKKIYDAAVEEFFEKTYNKATIRSISRKSGVPIGNIYRYYENKEAIFEDVVSEFYLELTRILKEEPTSPGASKEEILEEFKRGNFLTQFCNRIVDLDFKGENPKIVYILLNNSEGSRYANLKMELMDCFTENFYETFKKLVEDEKVLAEKKELLKIIASVFLKSIESVFNCYPEDKEASRKLLLDFANVYSKDLPDRLGL